MQVGGGGGFPRSFLKIEKKVLRFRKKCPDCPHLQITYLIQNAIWEYLGVKTPKFPVRGLIFVHCKTLIYGNPLIPKKTPLPEKLLVNRLLNASVLAQYATVTAFFSKSVIIYVFLTTPMSSHIAAGLCS